MSDSHFLIARESYAFLFYITIGFCIISCHVGTYAAQQEPPNPTKKYQSGESSVFVYDNILGKKLIRVSSEMVKKYATWYFVYPDPYEGIKDRENGDLHWVAPFSPKGFAKSRIWNGLRKGLDGIFNNKKLYPYEVNGVMLMRGFSPAVYKGFYSDFE